MKHLIAVAAFAITLGACADPKFTAAVAAGQLYCSKATTLGPLVVAIVEAGTGKPVTVTGKASDVVARSCALIGAIPVSPPADATTAPKVAVVVPG